MTLSTATEPGRSCYRRTEAFAARRWRHPLPVVWAIAAAAIQWGRRGYQALSLWAEDWDQKARARCRCRDRQQRYQVPSRTVLREVLTRVAPIQWDRDQQSWNVHCAGLDEGLAVDGKTRCKASDDSGCQTHILGAVGHQTQTCDTPKKVGALLAGDGDAVKQTHAIGMVIPVLEALDLAGQTLATAALLTQRKLATDTLARNAHAVFTVKAHQPSLRAAIRMLFEHRNQPDFSAPPTLAHGRIE